jgi:hypothetical protein
VGRLLGMRRVIASAGGWVLVLLLCRGAWAVQVDATDISGTNYFPAAHGALCAATNSITVAMYRMQLGHHDATSSPPARLVQDLVDAHKRGLKVTVILDESFRYGTGKARRLDSGNDVAIGRLSAAGVQVRIVPAGKTLHHKLVIVDGHTVLSGSHNWTYSALALNYENSDLIRSAEYAAHKLQSLSGMLAGGSQPVAVAQKSKTVGVPRSFLTDPQLAARMMSTGDERAFDTVLLLARIFHEGTAAGSLGEIMVDYDEVAAGLGVRERMSRSAYRRQIAKTLRKLQDRYGLVECEFKWGKSTRVRMEHGGDVISIPVGYWEYGHSTNLALSAKFAYVVALDQTASSPTKPWWSMSGEALAKQYSTTRRTVHKGLRALEKWDLLEIVRSNVPPGKSYKDRRPNRYRLVPLRSPAQVAQEWRTLVSRHGGPEVERARALAFMIDRGNSREVVANFLRVITKYGYEGVEKATKEVANMTPDNPCRHVGYIVTLVKE